MTRPVILTFVQYYLPGFKSGGPVRSISNMVARLGRDFLFRIITKDRDALESAPYAGIEIDGWNQVEGAEVFYLSPARRSWSSIARLINETPHDVLYLNSFFDPVFTLQPLLCRRLGLIRPRPTVIAPRGEFSSGALALKPHRKRAYLASMRLLGLYHDVVWHASSPFEAEDVRSAMGSAARRIIVAPNLPARIPVRIEPSGSSVDEPLRICFVSRVTPKKNLDFALQIIQRVSAPVVLDIYGVIDDERYWAECRRLMAGLPAHAQANYCGVLEHAAVAQALRRYDLFILPTLGENYGHAVFEALAAGVPVLISDRTPWRGLQDRGVGWDLPLGPVEPYVEVIENLAREDVGMRLARRRRAHEYASELSARPDAVESNIALFANLVRSEAEA